jgi:hypothetical protein
VTVRTLDELFQAVENRWPTLCLTDYSLKYKFDPARKDLYELLDFSVLKTDSINHVVVIPDLTGFSKAPKDKPRLLSYLEVKENNYIIFNEAFQECDFLESQIKAAAKIVVDDLMVRLKVYKPEISERISEYTCREFISPILVYSVNITIDYLKSQNINPSILLCCEKEILGRRYHGPVDYSLMYDIFDIILTEAKKSDITSGIYQNLLQQHASLEFISNLFTDKNYVGKRRRDEFEEIYNDLKLFGTAGIITTGNLWTFTKIVYFENAKYVYRSDEIALNLNSNDLSQSSSSASQSSAFLEQVTRLMRKICKLILDQIDKVNLKKDVVDKYHKATASENIAATILECQLDRAETFHRDFPTVDENTCTAEDFNAIE